MPPGCQLNYSLIFSDITQLFSEIIADIEQIDRFRPEKLATPKHPPGRHPPGRHPPGRSLRDPPRTTEPPNATPGRSQLSSNKKTPEYLSACLRSSEVLRSLDVGTASNVRRFSPSPYVLLDLFVREVPSRITVSRRIHALGILSSLEHSSGPNVDSKLIWWSSE